ncbi:hypothetical protein QBC35DRAFT_427985 [Podospora australis]|uniref:Meiotically up-regulated 65 protein n=1 Tax=Podospora australis TaxID=1536484 RepID=A0AAN6X270_9PEZI|nr:hypothetical protein QBC35DRAFT_427985 [Podospora australis]
MPRTKHHRSSRRVPPPKDSDFDHEINLVDNSEAEAEDGSIAPSITGGPSRSRQQSRQESRPDTPNASSSAAAAPTLVEDSEPTKSLGRPSIQIELPTPGFEDESIAPTSETQRSKSGRKASTPESAIDILYENQRGGFLCGIPLFSSKALGNLDPPPWTNYAHKVSPTDIHTAQVPDPSWEWDWPAWKINKEDGVDEDGWEYSFAFSKKFSWHKARWWNSFVRRRAWIRKRVQKDAGYISQDPHMLNPEYFSIRPSSEISRPQSPSKAAGSLRGSRLSVSSMGSEGVLEQPPNIENTDQLLRVLRASRIDREKIEAVDNYLDHAQDDLAGLQDVMHDVMTVFVFQASRKILLTRLTEVHDRATATAQKKQGKETSVELQRRAENLAAAVRHADEEVRKLEYWSDVKQMAEEGDSLGAVDKKKGWDPTWQGVDQSGPAAPPVPEHPKS